MIETILYTVAALAAVAVLGVLGWNAWLDLREDGRRLPAILFVLLVATGATVAFGQGAGGTVGGAPPEAELLYSEWFPDTGQLVLVLGVPVEPPTGEGGGTVSGGEPPPDQTLDKHYPPPTKCNHCGKLLKDCPLMSTPCGIHETLFYYCQDKHGPKK